MPLYRRLEAIAAVGACALALAVGCESDSSWQARDSGTPNRWSGSGSYSISGGWEEAALFFGPALALYAGTALVKEVGRLWDEWIDDYGMGVAWDSKEGRALRRGN